MMSWNRCSWAACAAALALFVSRSAFAGEANVALAGTATQSSIANGGNPERAIDGNTDGNWGGNSLTHTDPIDTLPWWQVDLGQTYSISRIVIWNRTDCCLYRLSNFHVSVQDGTAFEVWGQDCFTDLTYPSTQSYEVALPEVTDGQIVKIAMLGPNGNTGDPGPVLSLAEVEVYADTSAAPLTFTRQPASARTYEGKSVTFSVAVLDATGVTFQWKKGGEDISGATGPEYVICSAVGADSGTYTVTATRGAESVPSDPADLLVIEGNLALEGTASQSSTGWDGFPARAIDGNVDGVYGNNSVTHTNDAAPWWQVELPVTATIDSILIWGRTDACCRHRLSNFRISVLDNTSNELWGDDFFTDLTYPLESRFECVLPVAVDGRIVKIIMLGPNGGNGNPPPDNDAAPFASFAEVEVFGAFVDAPPDRGYAYGRPASQSSTNGAYAASLGVDGDLRNFTHTWSGDTNPASWQVDLCGQKDISMIILWNRFDCCRSRLRDITVEILDGPGGSAVWTSELLNPENVMGGSVEGLGPVNLVLDIAALAGAPVKGAALRVTRTPDEDLSGSKGTALTNTDEMYVLSLAEVEVYGPMTCPADGDTYCEGLVVEGPGVPEYYTLTASATDDSGDPVWYTFTLDDGVHPPKVIGPQEDPVLSTLVGVGSWTVTVTADDTLRCKDAAANATCTDQIDHPYDPANVAPLGTASQSSTGWGGLAERAIDGITRGDYGFGSMSHTADGDPTPWWQVTLDKTYAIDRILLWNRTDCCMQRLTNFRVTVLDESESAVFQEDYFIDGATYPDATLGGYEIPIGGDEGRTVKIEMLGPSVAYPLLMWACLAEVEVFKVVPPPSAPQNLVATAGVKKVDLVWAAPDGGPAYSGYAVYRDDIRIADLPAAQLSYTDEGLAAGVQVCYVIAAVQGAVKGADSNEDCATPLDDVVPTGFRRGDADGSGKLDLTDAIATLQFLYMGYTAPTCKDAADTDDSGVLDLTDAIASLQFQFMGGTPPAAPGPTECGPDPTPGDQYTECTYTTCGG